MLLLCPIGWRVFSPVCSVTNSAFVVASSSLCSLSVCVLLSNHALPLSSEAIERWGNHNNGLSFLPGVAFFWGEGWGCCGPRKTITRCIGKPKRRPGCSAGAWREATCWTVKGTLSAPFRSTGPLQLVYTSHGWWHWCFYNIASGLQRCFVPLKHVGAVRLAQSMLTITVALLLC